MRTRQNGSLQLDQRKKGPDVWVYRWREYLSDGKVKRHGEVVGTVEDFPTRAEAIAARRRRTKDASRAPVSFGALLDRYMSEEMPERHSTHLAYLSYIRQYIRPAWEDRPLSKFIDDGAGYEMEQWLKSLTLAPKTKGNIRNVMAVILAAAMRWGYLRLGVNPMSLVRVKGCSKRGAEPRILEPSEIQRLLAELPAEPFRTMAVMGLSTGLRCSELFGLKWKDLVWEKLTLLVRRAIYDGVVDKVKTKYSEAGLPLDPGLADVMLTWKRASMFSGDEDWVFASPQMAGELPYRGTYVLQKQLKPAAKRAGLGKIGWHTFRHTYSSLLRQNGEDVKVQQELMRHADIQTTLNVYTQAPSQQKREANSKIVRMVLPTGLAMDTRKTVSATPA